MTFLCITPYKSGTHRTPHNILLKYCEGCSSRVSLKSKLRRYPIFSERNKSNSALDFSEHLIRSYSHLRPPHNRPKYIHRMIIQGSPSFLCFTFFVVVVVCVTMSRCSFHVACTSVVESFSGERVMVDLCVE